VTDTLLALAALFGVPAALVTLIVLAALTVTRWRQHSYHPARPAPTRNGGAEAGEHGGLSARHAWSAAHMAHARITQLEQRIRQLEARSTPGGSDRP
jgi:hypothetical protein